jgi:hypothetical protein
MIPKSTPPAERGQQIARMLSMPRPKTYPAYRAVRVDPLSRIWVQAYEARDLWSVFDSTGTLLGNVTIPHYAGARAEVVALERDGIVLLHSDEDGARRLSFVRLLSRTGPRP